MLSLKLLTYKHQITVYMLAQKLQFTCYPQNYNLHVSPELQFTCYHTNYSLYMWPPQITVYMWAPKLQFTCKYHNGNISPKITLDLDLHVEQLNTNILIEGGLEQKCKDNKE